MAKAKKLYVTESHETNSDNEKLVVVEVNISQPKQFTYIVFR